MKCNQCGFEAAQDSLFCPQCGERMIQDASGRSVFADQLLPALKDPLFLVVCILLSISCLLSLSAGSVPLIDILITVFLWLTYAQARKDIADAGHLRCVSGALYAQYVIVYVVAGLLLVMGVILAISFQALTYGMEGFWEAFLGELVEAETAATLAAILPSVSGAVILIVCFLVCVITIVLNIFTMRYLHRFAQSVYRSIQQGTYALRYVKAAKILLFILGGFALISCLSDLSANLFGSFVANAASGSCSIICGLLIRKYLEPKA